MANLWSAWLVMLRDQPKTRGALGWVFYFGTTAGCEESYFTLTDEGKAKALKSAWFGGGPDSVLQVSVEWSVLVRGRPSSLNVWVFQGKRSASETTECFQNARVVRLSQVMNTKALIVLFFKELLSRLSKPSLVLLSADCKGTVNWNTFRIPRS